MSALGVNSNTIKGTCKIVINSKPPSNTFNSYPSTSIFNNAIFLFLKKGKKCFKVVISTFPVS